MQGYSVSGYLNAVIRRGGKSLLVEGVYDQLLLARLVGESHGRPTGIVDPVEIMTDSTLSGMGQRDRVLTVKDRVAQLPPHLRTTVSQKLGTLVDREWDGLTATLPFDDNWQRPTQTPPHFVTVGHSIENYFIDADSVLGYLRMFHVEHFNQQFFDELSARFVQIVALALCYSLYIKSAGALTRSIGAITRSDVAWTGLAYELRPSIEATLVRRGLATCVGMSQIVNTALAARLLNQAQLEPARWVAHGHLGLEVIWACIGDLANAHGANNQTQEAIERGAREQKFRFCSDFLCRRAAPEREPLDEALGWLSA